MFCANYKLKSIEKEPPAMKIAIPVWGDWVSTALDFTEALLLIDSEAGAVRSRTVCDVSGTDAAEKVARLRNDGVRVVLCGAVSQPMERMVRASGIELVPFLRGRTDDVLSAYLSGCLTSLPGFMLPGFAPGCSFGKGMGRGRHGAGPGQIRKRNRGGRQP